MTFDKIYNHKKFEDKIYQKWEKSRSFIADNSSKKDPFVISMPPPNATGTLHLGHAAFLAIQDTIIRFKRMDGYEVLWLPGTDHAAIATQNKVEQEIAKKGKTKYDLGREKFLQEVREFVKNSRNIIRNQIRKMGSSCDWSRERYTLDEGLSKAVFEVFVKMYNDGLIYRGNRIVNWCPRCESTLADDEVEYKEKQEKLYWIKYGPFTLATARPETKLGDTAVAVHPKDKRYKKWIGKKIKIPGVLGDFEVIVVADEAVDPKFGSGIIKVTPAHSFTDFEIAERHNIPIKSVIDQKGKMMANCGKYAGMTTEECRKEIVKDMEKMGLMLKIEDYNHNLSVCYRCGTPIEPLISKQWFINVDKPIIKEGGKMKTIKEKATEVVRNGKIKIIPNQFEKIYFHFLENLHDWCISRQIWWGHRIPVYYCKNCYKDTCHSRESGNPSHCRKEKGVMVSAEKPKKCPDCGKSDIRQDPDTLDTWFSSGLWTFSTLGWPEKTLDLKKFHPTSLMETGYDILFFWVARMIIMTTYTLKEIPFETVYLHGLVRDKQGRKMSKSLGNGIDPLDMIEKFGADALRLSLIIGSTPGNDIRLYEEKIKGYRNFTNKIWNAGRYVLMNVSKKSIDDKTEIDFKEISALSDKWILTELHDLVESVEKDLNNYRLSDAGLKIYNFFWCYFCDWYLEITKGEKRNEKLLLFILKNILKLLHPFVPYITEVLWKHVNPSSLLINETWPDIKKIPSYKEGKEMNVVFDTINSIRSLRNESKVDPKKKIEVILITKTHKLILSDKIEIIKKLAGLEKVQISENRVKCENAVCAVCHGIQIVLPVADLFDIKKEKERLKSEISILENYIKQIKGKLNNKNFTEKAPKEIVEKEQNKLKQKEKDILELKKRLNILG